MSCYLWIKPRHDNRQARVVPSLQMETLLKLLDGVGTLNGHHHILIFSSGTEIPILAVVITDPMGLQDGFPHQQVATIIVPHRQPKYSVDPAHSEKGILTQSPAAALAGIFVRQSFSSEEVKKVIFAALFGWIGRCRIALQTAGAEIFENKRCASLVPAWQVFFAQTVVVRCVVPSSATEIWAGVLPVQVLVSNNQRYADRCFATG